MTEIELYKIKGGAISGTIINGIVRAVDIVLELGRSLGSALRRKKDGSYC
jgi:hypothetical protein